MRNSDDPWERDSGRDRQHRMSPEDYATGSADPIHPPPGPWRRLRTWLFNVFPIALSLASMLLVLYLLATITGLR
jgi:hypothetical protein